MIILTTIDCDFIHITCYAIFAPSMICLYALLQLIGLCPPLTGMRMSQGSQSYADNRCTMSGRAADLVVQAGAIPLLVSNTPEFCYSWESLNFVTGRTLNPYDQRRTPGGSSGGEGALLGAGASLIGIGSDLAGSIRLPSLNNGIFGHKPTSGLIPLDGHMPHVDDPQIQNMLTIGPMCRYAKDLPLMFNIMSEGRALAPPVDLKDIKIFYKYKFGRGLLLGNMDQSLTRAQKETVKFFSGLGMQVRPLDVDLSSTMEFSVVHYCKVENIPDVLYNPNNPKKRRNWFWEVMKGFFGCGSITFAALFFQLLVDLRCLVPNSVVDYYCDEALKVRESIMDRLQHDGVLLFPTFGKPAQRHYTYFTNMMQVMYTAIFNVLNLPACNVQVGFNNNQLPVGFQVVAGPDQDHLCFQVAQAIEKQFGGWKAPSDV